MTFKKMLKKELEKYFKEEYSNWEKLLNTQYESFSNTEMSRFLEDMNWKGKIHFTITEESSDSDYWREVRTSTSIKGDYCSIAFEQDALIPDKKDEWLDQMEAYELKALKILKTLQPITKAKV